MSNARPFSILNNKVELVGEIVSDPALTVRKASDQAILTFVIAVSREDLPSAYDDSKFCYFVCRLIERVVGGEKINSAMKTIMKGDFLQVFGMLDAFPIGEQIKSPIMSYKVRNGFRVFVSVIDWKDGTPYLDKLKGAKRELDDLHHLFGQNAEIILADEEEERKKEDDDSGLGSGLPDY